MRCLAHPAEQVPGRSGTDWAPGVALSVESLIPRELAIDPRKRDHENRHRDGRAVTYHAFGKSFLITVELQYVSGIGGAALSHDEDQIKDAQGTVARAQFSLPAIAPEPELALQRARDLNRPTTLDYFGLLLDDFEELLRPYGIVELARTGRVALPKIDNSSARLRAVRGA